MSIKVRESCRNKLSYTYYLSCLVDRWREWTLNLCLNFLNKFGTCPQNNNDTFKGNLWIWLFTCKTKERGLVSKWAVRWAGSISNFGSSWLACGEWFCHTPITSLDLNTAQLMVHSETHVLYFSISFFFLTFKCTNISMFRKRNIYSNYLSSLHFWWELSKIWTWCIFFDYLFWFPN